MNIMEIMIDVFGIMTFRVEMFASESVSCRYG